jgi:hypothetical protein
MGGPGMGGPGMGGPRMGGMGFNNGGAPVGGMRPLAPLNAMSAIKKSLTLQVPKKYGTNINYTKSMIVIWYRTTSTRAVAVTLCSLIRCLLSCYSYVTVKSTVRVLLK